MKTIETYVTDWLAYLEREKFSMVTVASRKSSIRPFVAFLEHEGISDLRKVDEAVIARYSEFALKSPSQYSAHSIANLYSVVKAFFHYLRRKKVIANYPCYDLARPMVVAKNGVYQKAQRWANNGDPVFEPLRLEFIEHLSRENFSPDSIKGYGYNVREFFTYLTAKGITDVRRAGLAEVRAYSAYLSRKYAKGFWSVSIKLRALYNLFQFLVKTGQVTVNPCKELKQPKLKKQLPRNILTEAEAKKILDQPDLTKSFGITDRAILETFYSTGIRRKEMAGLTIQDIDFKSGTLFVRDGKWNKQRIVPLGPHALKFIDQYLKQVRPKYAKRQKTPSDALWIGNGGRPVSKQSIAKRVMEYGRKAKIKGKKLSPHVWRHTFATSLIRGGADIRHVQEFLGHSRTSSSMVYTKVTGADIKKEHSKAYPEKPERTMPKVKALTRGWWKKK